MLLESEKIINEKIESRLKEKLVEDENLTWPCLKCKKFFETQEYLIIHFTQKHQKSVDKYKQKILKKEIYKYFL